MPDFVVGDHVKITKVSYANHADQIGRTGTLLRFIKTRGVWLVEHDDHRHPQRTEKDPRNIERMAKKTP